MLGQQGQIIPHATAQCVAWRLLKSSPDPLNHVRVVYLSPSSALGGAERTLLCLLENLRKEHPDWNLHVVSIGSGPLIDMLAILGIQTSILRLPDRLKRLGDAGVGRDGSRKPTSALSLIRAALCVPGLVLCALKLHKLLTELKPDIIHSNGLKMHLLGSLAKPAGTPLIWHIHEYISSRPLVRRALRLCRTRYSAAIANSHSVALDLSNAGMNSAPVHTIWNAIDLDRFSPIGPTVDLDALANSPPAAAGTVRIGMIATFARWKGHEVVLKALALLPRSLPFRAYVVGAAIYDTDESQFTKDELQALATSLKIADKVVFTGFISNTATAIRSLDIVIHASTRPEPFGLAIAEAMACGKPLIVSNAGGAVEIVKQTDVLLHEPGNAEDLARCICTLVKRRRQTVSTSRIYAERNFAPTRFMQDIAAVYFSCSSMSYVAP